MARYYEENALIEFVKQYTPTINGETTMKCVERAIHNAPTADVVPRAEVEREYGNALQTAFNEGKLEGEKEVAREIFEDIEFDIHQLMFEREENRAIAIEGVIAELKKKYKEGKEQDHEKTKLHLPERAKDRDPNGQAPRDQAGARCA